MLRKREKAEADAKRQSQKKLLLEKYGGEEHLKAAPLHDAAVIENERFVEYDETGAIKGAPKKAVKSKYAEDVLVNNHISVWGSWWCNFEWGYSCCHSTVKNSYCTGEEGKKAFEDMRNMTFLDGPEEPEPQEDVEEEREQEEESKRVDVDQRKRDLRALQQGIDEEELESYKRSRLAAADPMAGFLGKDKLIK
jgi:pre-mRNA-processing factor SLU7